MIKEQLLDAHSKGLSDRKIAKLLSVHHSTVRKYRSILGLSPNGTTRKGIIQDEIGQIVCSKCFQPKPLWDYTINRRGQKTAYRLSACNTCRKLMQVKNLNRNLMSFMSDRWNRLKNRSLASNIPFSIIKEDLLHQFDIQSGRCFYTDVLLDWGAGKGARSSAMSFDKVVPELGYIKGNVVLCCSRINTVKCDLTLEEIKDWMPGWYERILKFRSIANLECGEPQGTPHS